MSGKHGGNEVAPWPWKCWFKGHEWDKENCKPCWECKRCKEFKIRTINDE